MANKKESDRPETGWGEMLPKFFNDGIVFYNHAVNGRSTKSFRERGHWDELYEQLEKNDFVIIQFGHNDSKKDDPERYADAKTDYKINLENYIRDIREKGAIPVLAIPVWRRKFDDNGQLVDSHGAYPEVVRQVAREKKVDLLDMHLATKKVLEEAGPTMSSYLFMHYPDKMVSKFPNGIHDDTHFSPYGASRVAAAACTLLVDLRHPLRNFLKKSVFPETMEYQLPQIVPVMFRKDTFMITKYGAAPGINKTNTQAIQQAIDEANRAGGGVVLIPSGLWITGPLVIKSNVNLHLHRGALLQFSEDRNLYPIVETTWEGQRAYRCQAPISARNQQNIAITGKGTIDGAGHVWKSVRKSKLTEGQWMSLIKSGGVHDGKIWYPSESSRIGHGSEWAKKISEGKSMVDYEAVRDYLRPNFVSFMECSVIQIEGPTFNNSPAWTLHPLLCTHITVKDVTVINPWYGHNNDAIDLESCEYAILDNCMFDTGDDAITIKSGRDAEGRKRGRPTAHCIIKNTTVLHGHGGFVIGSEMSGGVHHMYVNNCTFLGTDIGLRFKTTRGRGGVVSDIFISDIHMNKIVGEAVLFNMFYAARDPITLPGDDLLSLEVAEEPVTEETPEFRNFYFENIFCQGAKTAIKMDGLAEKNISGIYLKNGQFSSGRSIEINDADGVKLHDILVRFEQGPAMQIRNGKNLECRNCTFLNDQNPEINVSGKKSKNILVDSGSSQLIKASLDNQCDVSSIKIK